MITTLCYIDPASTALIWQVLAGIFIGLGAVFAVFWKKITTFFKSLWVKLFRKNKGETAEKVIDEAALEVEDEIAENVEEDKKENADNETVANQSAENEVSEIENTETSISEN